MTPASAAVSPDRLENTWRRFVDLESGSHEGDAIRRFGLVMADLLSESGFKVKEAGQAASGASHLVAERPGVTAEPVMLLGHLDTVWASGALTKNPFRWVGEKLMGPGIADMKGGLAVLNEVVQSLPPDRSPAIRVVLTADEELGSPTGRSVVEENAAGCSGVFVFEAGRPGGHFVDSRRGIAVFTMTVHGRKAHAGNDPERGINAVDELAHQLLSLAEMRNPAAGIYVMAGLIEGGTARQVVPDLASALIDVRGATRTGLDQAMASIRSLTDRTHVPGVMIEITGGETRPPFESTASEALKSLVTSAGADQGIAVSFVKGGGGSDGNFTGALGLPTIDGCGPIGERLCSWDETADFASAVSRSNLIVSALKLIALTPHLG
jgi:glutamate carboxypeptidase